MKPEELMDAMGGIDPVYVEEAEKYKRSRKIGKNLRVLLPVAACFCLMIAGSAYGLLQQEKGGMAGGTGAGNESAGILEAAGEEEFAGADGAAPMEGAPEEGAEANAELAGGESDGFAPEETYIVLNEIENWSQTSNSIERVDYYQEYALEELSDYYGVRVVPENLPEDLRLEENGNPYMVAYLNGGKVVDDKNRIAYWNADRTRKLVIHVNKVESSDLIIIYGGDNPQKSLIYGTEVLIGHDRDDENEGYMAEFKNGDVTFTLQAVNLSEEEFVGILKSLLEKET